MNLPHQHLRHFRPAQAGDCTGLRIDFISNEHLEMKMSAWMLNFFKELGPTQKQKKKRFSKVRLFLQAVLDRCQLYSQNCCFPHSVIAVGRKPPHRKELAHPELHPPASAAFVRMRWLAGAVTVFPQKMPCDLSLLFQAQCPLSESNFPVLWMSASSSSGAFLHWKLEILLC